MIMLTTIMIVLTMIQPEIMRVINPVITTIRTHNLLPQLLMVANTQDIMTQHTKLPHQQHRSLSQNPSSKQQKI